MLKLTQCLLKVPENIYAIMFYGGGFVALISTGALIWGALRKKRKKFFIIWVGIFLLSIILLFLTTSGIILADAMFGG